MFSKHLLYIFIDPEIKFEGPLVKVWAHPGFSHFGFIKRSIILSHFCLLQVTVVTLLSISQHILRKDAIIWAAGINRTSRVVEGPIMLGIRSYPADLIRPACPDQGFFSSHPVKIVWPLRPTLGMLGRFFSRSRFVGLLFAFRFTAPNVPPHGSPWRSTSVLTPKCV